MDLLLEQISVDASPAESTAVLTTLGRILGNVVKSPENAKYRTLKMTSKAMSEGVAQSQAAVSLLLAVGFNDCGVTLECPMDTDLQGMSEVVDLIAAVLLSQGDEGCLAPKPTPTIVGGVIDRKAYIAPQAPSAAQATFQRRDGSEQHVAKDGFRASLDSAQQRSRAGENETQFKRKELPSTTEAEIQRAREVRKAQYVSAPAAAAPMLSTTGACTSAPVPGPAPVPAQSSAAKKKSAFDFQSRSEKARMEREAAESLEEMRQAQKERYSKALENPSALKSEAYVPPPAIAQSLGTNTRARWCCLTGGRSV